MDWQLRPYQEEAVGSVIRLWDRGKRAVLGTAATGAGKTCIFLEILTRQIDAHGGRGLILAHRKELIDQPVERLAQMWPGWALRAGVVMASSDRCDKDITVATVQTLHSEKRMARLLAHGPIQWLITDEAHHSVSPTYRAVYKMLREANPNLRHLGVTATPIRADGTGLIEVFEEEAFHYGIREMVRMGYLVPPRWLAIQTGISLKGVKQVAGDYAAKSLANVYETKNCFDLVVESHKQYAEDRQAIAFVPTVEGAYALADTFNEAGILAMAADGTTRKGERNDILTRFRAGHTRVLVNVGLYTEGLDVPEVACIHMVRPTQSDGLYIQCVGRGLRTAIGKNDCLILDYSPVESRNVCMLGDVLGVPARKDVYMKRDAEPGEVVGGFTFDGEVKWLEGDAHELISRELDYLEMSPWSWHREGEWLTLGLGEGSDGYQRTLAITPPLPNGLFTLWGVAKRKGGRWAAKEILTGSFEDLSEIAEGIIQRRGNGQLMAKERSWRRQVASPAQEQFARRLGVWRHGLSKGECARVITHALAMEVIAKAAPVMEPEAEAVAA